jgi:hypothetical protein
LVDPFDDSRSSDSSLLLLRSTAESSDGHWAWMRASVASVDGAGAGVGVSARHMGGGAGVGTKPPAEEDADDSSPALSEEGGAIAEEEEVPTVPTSGRGSSGALPCPATVRVIRAAFAPCSRRGSYFLYPPRTRDAVMVWLLVAARLWPVVVQLGGRAMVLCDGDAGEVKMGGKGHAACDPDEGAALGEGGAGAGAGAGSVVGAGAASLPWMPPELVRYIAGSFPRIT